VIAVPFIVAGFKGINKHYVSVARQLRAPGDRPRRVLGTRAVLLVQRADEATMRALGYARALRPTEVRALYVGEEESASTVQDEWGRRGIRVPLEHAPEGDLTDGVRRYVRGIEREGDEFVTVVVPEIVSSTGLGHYIRGRRELMLKAAMLFEPQVVLTDVPFPADGAGSSGTESAGPIAPSHNIAIVLVSAVHNATLRALDYAKAIRPTEMRAVMFNLDERETRKIMLEWTEAGTDVPLEVIDSPYREVTRPLLKMINQIRKTSPDTVVTVIVPEFVVRKWWHQFLHNQTALGIKAALLFEPRVVVTSIPYHLE